MGDPRRLKKKYATPSHPFQKVRIDEEGELLKEFGLKNKTEVWKSNSKLKDFASQAKRLIAARGAQADVERKQLFARLERLGLLPSGAALDDVLGLRLNKLLERRLQTLVFKKGLSRSIKQSRQFITHEHIAVNGKVVSAPGHLVSVSDELTISFVPSSAIALESHPERALPKPTATVINPDKDAQEQPLDSAKTAVPASAGTTP